MADEQTQAAPSISLPTLDAAPVAEESAGAGAGESHAPAQTTSTTGQGERGSLPVTNLTTLSASARTSHTQVDMAHTEGGPHSRDSGEVRAGGEVAVSEENEREGQTEHGSGGEGEVPTMPVVSLTFLLVSGRRRTMVFEQEMTVGRVKELVWNAWPNEWQDERPPAPSYLRILYLGKILQDDDTLTKVGFTAHTPSKTAGAVDTEEGSRAPSPPPPTIVHLSIRAYAPAAPDTPKKRSTRRQRRSGDVGGGETEGGDAGGTTSGGAGCCGGCIVC